MDWLKEILEGLEDAKELEKKIAKGIGENFVAKSDFNKVNNEKKDLEADLEKANKTLKDIKKDNEDIEELQNKITNYETEIANLKAERETEKKKYKVESALKDAGAIDTDYLIFKLGGVDELELDKDGEIKDLDSIVKDLKEEYGKFFDNQEDEDRNNDDKGADEEVSESLKLNVLEQKLPDGDVDDDKGIAETFADALKGNF